MGLCPISKASTRSVPCKGLGLGVGLDKECVRVGRGVIFYFPVVLENSK